MGNIKLSTEVFERYLDASVELFMECYAETITLDSNTPAQEQGSPRLAEKCKALIKAAHRRQKLMGFMKGSVRLLKSVAVIAIAFLALSSFLFITVDAVREPILKFYIKQNDGNWELSNTPFGKDSNSALEGGFNEKDPLGALLPDDFYLHSIEGNLNDGLAAVYFNDDNSAILLTCEPSDNQYHINTENSEVEQIAISGYDAVLSIRKDNNSAILAWYDSDLEIFVTLSTNNFSRDEIISIAQIISNQLMP